MGIIATVVSYNGTLTNAGGNADLLELTPADDYPVRLRRLILSQGSELGDAAEEQLRITVRRLGATVTSGGTNGTTGVSKEIPDSGGGAAQLTAEANNTSPATTSGADDILFDGYWNVRQREEFYWPDDKFMPCARAGEVLVVRSEGTPTDDITFSVTAEIEEG